MSFKVIELRTNTGEPLDERAVREIVDGQDGASQLPSPLIFPPIYFIRGTQETVDKLQEKFGDKAIIKVHQQSDE